MQPLLISCVVVTLTSLIQLTDQKKPISFEQDDARCATFFTTLESNVHSSPHENLLVLELGYRELLLGVTRDC
jgi:hypothetical protein